MKALFNIVTLLGFILLFACTQNPLGDTTAQEDSLTGKSLLIKAIAVQNESGSKTVTETGAEIIWQPNDQISVFYGSTFQGKFQYNGTEPMAQAEFEGTLSVVTGALDTPTEDRVFWGVYPYRDSNTCNGTTVTTIIPDHQTAIVGSFDPAALVTVAQSSGLAMAFYNVCGG
ncbi:MAG: hypothetical protein J6W01_02215, partial [Bacteroidales bacterium]|nr:hypothetical protein [Bacteroidales bacterium]